MRAAEELPADAGAGSEDRRYVQVFRQAEPGEPGLEDGESPLEAGLQRPWLFLLSG